MSHHIRENRSGREIPQQASLLSKKETTLTKLRTHITYLEAKNAELRERLIGPGDRETYERQIRDLKRELDRRDRIIYELRSKGEV